MWNLPRLGLEPVSPALAGRVSTAAPPGKPYFILLINFFGHVACGILVPRPEIERVPPAVEARSLNHWTAREVPSFLFFN